MDLSEEHVNVHRVIEGKQNIMQRKQNKMAPAGLTVVKLFSKLIQKTNEVMTYNEFKK